MKNRVLIWWASVVKFVYYDLSTFVLKNLWQLFDKYAVARTENDTLVKSTTFFLSNFVAFSKNPNFNETQISKPPEATKHHKSTKLLILLPLRADLLIYTLQYETPCSSNESESYLFTLSIQLVKNFSSDSSTVRPN